MPPCPILFFAHTFVYTFLAFFIPRGRAKLKETMMPPIEISLKQLILSYSTAHFTIKKSLGLIFQEIETVLYEFK